MKDVVIYTDGACKGNPGPGGWGVFIKDQFGDEEEYYGGTETTTNNQMELMAAIKALEISRDHHEGCRIIVYTDSNYVKRGITEWMSSWIHRGWRTAANKPVKNKNLWISLNMLQRSVDVEWRWVKGHNNNPGNERADKLANMGAKVYL